MGDNTRSPDKVTVLVTGFGPFATHPVNASWVAVRELSEMGVRDDVNLIVKEIPVEYETVQAIVPELWKELKPRLVVHVGVSGVAKDLTLEQRAHNDGYDKQDICDMTPNDYCCISGAPMCLVSRLDMKRVSDAVNYSDCGVVSVVSYDPGRYLCDYIYFTSLNIDRSCTAFIHVPPLDRPYSAQQLARAIKTAILEMLDQLSC